MRVYSKVVIDMASGKVEEKECFDYQGPIAKCKGGETQSYDPAFNARMADLYERQQEMAEEQYGWYKKHYRPYEKMKIKQSMKLMPTQTKLVKSFYKDALTGVDAEGYKAKGLAGVEQQFANSQASLERDFSRMGIDPSSGRGIAMSTQSALSKAKTKAGISSAVDMWADEQNFARKQAAVGTNLGINF